MCGIDQNSIDYLDLIVSSNNRIVKVSFMKNLKILYAAGEYGINQNGRIRESRLSNSTCR
jgi:hypothetical protein